MNRIEKLKQLAPGDWRLLLQAACLFPLTTVMLRFRGAQGAKEWLGLGAFDQKELSAVDQKTEARRIARMVNIAAFHGLYRPRCLNRSLVLCHLLEKSGLDCELVMGARLDEGDFSAHAWVEHGDEVLNDDQQVRKKYRRFDQGVDAKS